MRALARLSWIVDLIFKWKWVHQHLPVFRLCFYHLLILCSERRSLQIIPNKVVVFRKRYENNALPCEKSLGRHNSCTVMDPAMIYVCIMKSRQACILGQDINYITTIRNMKQVASLESRIAFHGGSSFLSQDLSLTYQMWHCVSVNSLTTGQRPILHGISCVYSLEFHAVQTSCLEQNLRLVSLPGLSECTRTWKGFLAGGLSDPSIHWRAPPWL